MLPKAEDVLIDDGSPTAYRLAVAIKKDSVFRRLG